MAELSTPGDRDDENPYRSPAVVRPEHRRANGRKSTWSVLLWSVIGLGAGTGHLSPTILSAARHEQVMGE